MLSTPFNMGILDKRSIKYFVVPGVATIVSIGTENVLTPIAIGPVTGVMAMTDMPATVTNEIVPASIACSIVLAFSLGYVPD